MRCVDREVEVRVIATRVEREDGNTHVFGHTGNGAVMQESTVEDDYGGRLVVGDNPRRLVVSVGETANASIHPPLRPDVLVGDWRVAIRVHLEECATQRRSPVHDLSHR